MVEEKTEEEKFQEFLKKNGCVSDSKDLFVIKYNADRTEAYLWKKIDTLKL